MLTQIRILDMGQDDPKKCTAKRLARFDLAKLFKRMSNLPQMGVLLDPFCTTPMSTSDSLLVEVGGLVAVDCSWKNASEIFPKLQLYGLESRSLPEVIPVNPVNSGKVGKLTTAEALAAGLMIAGFEEDAAELMSVFKWGPSFLRLNTF